MNRNKRNEHLLFLTPSNAFGRRMGNFRNRNRNRNKNRNRNSTGTRTFIGLYSLSVICNNFQIEIALYGHKLHIVELSISLFEEGVVVNSLFISINTLEIIKYVYTLYQIKSIITKCRTSLYF